MSKEQSTESKEVWRAVTNLPRFNFNFNERLIKRLPNGKIFSIEDRKLSLVENGKQKTLMIGKFLYADKKKVSKDYVWKRYEGFPGLLIDIKGRRVKRDSKLSHTVYKLGGDGPQKINSVRDISTVKLPRLFYALLHGCTLKNIPGNVMISRRLDIIDKYRLAVENLKKAKLSFSKEEIGKRINRDIDYLNVLKKAYKTGDFKIVMLIINRQKELATRIMKNFRCARTAAEYYADMGNRSVMSGKNTSYLDGLLYQHARWLYMDEKKKKQIEYIDNYESKEEDKWYE